MRKEEKDLMIWNPLASMAEKRLINEGLNEVVWVLHNEFWWKASYEQFDGVVVDTIKCRVLVESK